MAAHYLAGPWGYCCYCARLVTAREIRVNSAVVIGQSVRSVATLQLDEHWLGAHLKGKALDYGPSAGACKGSFLVAPSDSPAEDRMHGFGFSGNPAFWAAEDKLGIPANGWGNS